MRKPTVRKPLRKGTLVYHATSVEEEFEDLEGPAWVSPTGSDTMICDPSRFLELVEVIER